MRATVQGILVVTLALAGTATADMTSVSSSPLSDFVIFSGGGANYNSQTNYETAIGGHTTVTGKIGSNQDLRMIGGQDGTGWAQVNGSVYVGGYLNMGQPLTFGSTSLLASVVVNGTNPTAPSGTIEADITGTIYGNLYTTGDVRLGSVSAVRKVGGVGGNVQYTGNYTALSGSVVEGTATQVPSTTTFPIISMPAATSFTAGGANQTVPLGPGVLVLAPNTYGTLSTSAQNQTVRLSSGNYYFDAITAQGNFTLDIDLTSGQPISMYVVGDATFATLNTLRVKGAGTGGTYVPISSAQSLASLIYLETRSRFVMGGAFAADRSTWGGTVYASLREDATASGSVGEVQIGQYMDWYGAVYAFDSVDIADHGTWTHVPVPEPATLSLLALGGLALIGRRRRRFLRIMRSSGLLMLLVLVLHSSAVQAAPITNLDSYVLFATGNGVPLANPVLSLKGGNAAGRGLVYGGNVGVNKKDSNLNNDPAMIAVGLNGKFIMQSGYQLVGDSIRLGVEAVVYDVYTNKQVGTGWGTPGVVNGTISTFTAPLLNPMPSLFDPFSTSSTTDIVVPTGTTYNGGTPLTPGA